ncbi:MAG: flagellar type III secretion system protein FliR [Selenomonadaceae bacterium]|nr:flagellar type III secretion system protein FliR [Selenomonadaceae bacterium]
MDLYDIFQGQVAAFLLVLTRTSGIFLISPFFGSLNVPIQFRAAAAITMAMVIFPVIVRETVVTAPATVLMFAATVIQEMFIGWLIGFIAFVVMAAINMAGKIMDLQIGFAVANVMDPTSGQQSPLIGSFFYNLSVIYFLIVNGHHMIITGLVESFRSVPIDSIVWNPALTDFMINLTNGVFLTGMKIAMPVTFAILITNVGMGILARTMPQMNIFVVGIPMHLMIGLFMLAMLMPFYVLFLDVMFSGMYSSISTAIKLISP